PARTPRAVPRCHGRSVAQTAVPVCLFRCRLRQSGGTATDRGIFQQGTPAAGHLAQPAAMAVVVRTHWRGNNGHVQLPYFLSDFFRACKSRRYLAIAATGDALAD